MKKRAGYVRLAVATLLVATLLLGGLSFLTLATPTTTQAAPAGFVYRCGIRFCLDGKYFYFAGSNTYDMFTYGDGSSTGSATDIETKFIDKARIDAHFTRLQQDKVTVLRVWMFNHTSWHGFEKQKGVYDEPQFKLFDYIIESAKAHGVRLIPTFENYWPDYGGADTRLSWEGQATGDANRWRFFRKDLCPGCFTSYKNYVNYALNRVNHYSNIAYKNDPTIFAWDLMNEPRYQNASPNEDTTGTTLRAWVDEMAGYIKGIDTNHMVNVGLEAHESRFGFGGNEGNPFVKIHQSPYIDMTSAHLYPTESWANLSLDQSKALIRTWINESHNTIGKPFFMGEFNVHNVDRSAWWQGLYGEMEASGGDGSAFWWYQDHSVDAKFGVLQGASELAAFRQHSTNMQAKNVTVGGTTPTPTPTTGTGTATVLANFEGGNLEGWTGYNQKAGPWSVTEWAANGSYSLKADVNLAGQQTELRSTGGRNFSGKTALKASVKHAPWGTMGSGMTAKIFIKTGSGWTWYSSNAVAINSSSATVLTLNLSGIANLGDVKEIGVEFTSAANSSGSSAVYVDYVTLQ